MKQKTREQVEKNLREGLRKFGSEYAAEDKAGDGNSGYVPDYASDYLANTAGSMIYNPRPFEAQNSDESQNLADVLETDNHESGAAGSTRPTGPAASAGYGARRRK
ncbi:MAG: hypothetical protein ACM3TT_09235 [Syntrophothermus sp.]